VFFHVQDYCFLQQMLQSLAHQLSCRYHGLLLQTGRTVSLTTLSTPQTPVEQSVPLTPQMVVVTTLLISHAVMLRLRSVDGVREERERGATPKKFTQVCVQALYVHVLESKFRAIYLCFQTIIALCVQSHVPSQRKYSLIQRTAYHAPYTAGPSQ